MKKYENFCNALSNLKDIYDYEEPYGNVELTGLVGLFEVCFEQAWKAMKEILEAKGAKVAGSVSKKTSYLVNNDVESSSSKNKKAKELGIPIINEETLMEMMK